MSSRERQGRSDRVPITGPTSGRVVTTDTGVAQVDVRGLLVTATLGAPMLCAMAADPDTAPRPGDRVGLLGWSDGHLTIERVIARPV